MLLMSIYEVAGNMKHEEIMNGLETVKITEGNYQGTFVRPKKSINIMNTQRVKFSEQNLVW